MDTIIDYTRQKRGEKGEEGGGTSHGFVLPSLLPPLPSLLVLLLLATGLTGCYDSPVPIAPAETAIQDARLVGRWKIVGAEGENADVYMLVIPFDEHVYYVEYCCDSDDWFGITSQTDTLRFRMFITPVEDVPFVNLKPIGLIDEDDEDTEPPYMLASYRFTPEGYLSLMFVGEDLVEDKPQTSQALFDFIRKNLKNPKLFMDDDDEEYFRKVR